MNDSLLRPQNQNEIDCKEHVEQEPAFYLYLLNATCYANVNVCPLKGDSHHSIDEMNKGNFIVSLIADEISLHFPSTTPCAVSDRLP
jgi:hypothetical protein